MQSFISFFVQKVTDEWGVSYTPTKFGIFTFLVILILLLLFACYFSNSDKHFHTKQLIISAMAMALAFVTSLIKIIDMPMGGSVTLFSMLFICLIGYWFGLQAGLCTAIAYGFLQLICDPYIISFPQMLIDYIFAFGALGLSGLFHDKKHGCILGYTVAVLGRYFFAVLSGIVFFGSSASAYNMSAFVYSIVYNGAYIGLEYVLTIIVLQIPAVKKALVSVKNLASYDTKQTN